MTRRGGKTFCFSVAVVIAVSLCAYLSVFPVVTHAGTPIEIVYDTFLDPSNKSDPRSAAQDRMIEEFERANPGIRVKLLVDSSMIAGARALRTRAESPDVIRLINYQVAEFAAPGALQPLNDLIKRDGIDEKDWLLPLSSETVNGRIFSLPQDYRISILIYRKHLLAQANVRPPRTWNEVCEAGGKLTKGNVIGFPVGIGSSGGLGGAQMFGEFFLSTLLPGAGGKYFADDHKAIAFSKESFLKTAQLIRDLFGKCKAATPVNLQFGWSEVHDGLRAGSIAMANFAVYRFRAIQRGGAGDDLAWSPPPGYTPDDPQTVNGFRVTLNAFSKHKEEAWAFMKFMTSPAGQALQAQGGEVVARTSAYKDAYFSSSEAQNQREWAELVKKRGQTVSYSLISNSFHNIVGDAFQRMILKNATPEDTYTEVVSKYSEALGSLK